MPLVRLKLKNEYGLGDPELYRGAARREDPKAVLDGVAVAGLVGILRQLGDLAGFAAEVFHDLHEQVAATSARGRRMMSRIQHLESSLPEIEMVIQSQKSHIHFAYLPGSDWHANVQVECDHLLRSDLPRFMLDSYEECRDPPRLFLLDKFDGAGAGACLKRYSDPTYFKRVWASSEIKKEEKIQKEKKIQKIKRKGSQMSNTEIQRAISLSRGNSSTQFASPGTDEQSFAEETLSPTDTKLKSESESRSASFDSRTRFSYEETAAASATTLKEPVESVNCHLAESHTENRRDGECVSLLTDEPNETAFEVSLHDSLQEKNCTQSSSVTWDEKTEILQPMSPKFSDVDFIEMVQTLQSSSVISAESEDCYVTETGLLDRRNIPTQIETVPDQVSLPLITDCMPEVYPVSIPPDEVTSETDNYVDALNSLESEIETDSEFQTIREVKPSSTRRCELDNRTSNLQELDDSKSDISSSGTHTLSGNAMDEDLSSKFPNSCDLDGSTCLQSQLDIDRPPEQYPIVHDMCGRHDNLSSDTYEARTFEDDSQFAKDDVVGNHLSGSDSPNFQSVSKDEDVVTCESIIRSCESSEEPSIQIWTNGGLLGLEPSKPPDFNTPATGCSTSFCSAVIGNCNISEGLDRPSDEIKPKASVPSHTDATEAGHGNRSSNIQESLPESSKRKADTFQSVHSRIHHKEDYVIRSNDILPGTSVELTSSQGGVEHTHKSLASGMQEKESFAPRTLLFPTKPVSNLAALNYTRSSDDNQNNLGSAAFQSHDVFDPKEKIEASRLEDKIFSKSSNYPSPSSPPLEHMKVSFNPLSAPVASKLKLEFPDGHLNESIDGLMFPSFQLLPEPDVSPHISSESDDDTFCRSSPYYSENISSHHSDSDSELWELDEQTRNLSVDDVSHPISLSTPSVCSSSDFDGMNACPEQTDCADKSSKSKKDEIIPFQASYKLDIPVLYTLNSSFNSLGTVGHLKSNGSPTCVPGPQIDLPPPPPLPPVQWRVLKSSSFPVEGEQLSSMETISYSDIVQSQQSPRRVDLISPRSLPSSFNENEVHAFHRKKDADQVGNDKELGERGDLLYQIRNKSFNLRRTTTTKPSCTPGPTANVKVAAILEKANAIRKAFASSDDGCDEENWSDN